MKITIETHSSLTVKPNTVILHRQTLNNTEVCRNYGCAEDVHNLLCLFLSLHLILLPLGSVAKVSFRFPGEKNLEAALDDIHYDCQ